MFICMCDQWPYTLHQQFYWNGNGSGLQDWNEIDEEMKWQISEPLLITNITTYFSIKKTNFSFRISDGGGLDLSLGLELDLLSIDQDLRLPDWKP